MYVSVRGKQTTRGRVKRHVGARGASLRGVTYLSLSLSIYIYIYI